MSGPHALAALAALGQPTRLAIFQLLMRAEPYGRAAGAIADKVGCPHNTLSSHLSILARSGLVRGKYSEQLFLHVVNNALDDAEETVHTLLSGFQPQNQITPAPTRGALAARDRL